MAKECMEALRTLPRSSDNDRDDDPRMKQLWRLAGAGRPVVVELFKQWRAEPTNTLDETLRPAEMGYLVNILLGLDRDGSRSREIALTYLLPALQGSTLPAAASYMLDCERLHVDAETARLLFAAGLRRVERGMGEERKAGGIVRSPVGRLGETEARDPPPRALAEGRTRFRLTLARFAARLTGDDSLRYAQEIVRAQRSIAGLRPIVESLMARLSSLQTATAVGDLLDRLRQEPIAHENGHRKGNLPEFRAWTDLLGTMVQRLAPADSRSLGEAAAESLKGEKGDKLPALAMAFLPLFGRLSHDEIAPALHSVIDALPSADEHLLRSLSDKIVPLLSLADATDVSAAARRMRDRLISDTRHGHMSPERCDAFVAWAPAIARSDAFDFAQSFAGEMVAMHPKHVVATLSMAVEKFSAGLSSRQSLAVAQTLVNHLTFDDMIDDHPGLSAGNLAYEIDKGFNDWLPVHLAYTVETLASRLDGADLRVLVVRLRARIRTEKDAATVAWLRDLLPRLRHPSSATAQGAGGPSPGQAEKASADVATPAPVPHDIAGPAAAGDVCRLVDGLLAALFRSRLPSKRNALIQEILNLTSGWRKPLTLAAYERPISVQQLYVDLLKEFLVDDDAWRALVRGLLSTSGRPANTDVWDYADWTEHSDEGRSLAVDWNSPPPLPMATVQADR